VNEKGEGGGECKGGGERVREEEKGGEMERKGDGTAPN